MMTLYVYRLSDGLFMYEDAGSPSGIILDLGEGEHKDKDFTLKQPPNSEQEWYWLDDQWIEKPKTLEEPVQ